MDFKNKFTDSEYFRMNNHSKHAVHVQQKYLNAKKEKLMKYREKPNRLKTIQGHILSVLYDVQ